MLERQNKIMETLLLQQSNKLQPSERTFLNPFTVPTNNIIPNQFVVDKVASNNIHQLLQNTISLHRLHTSSMWQGDAAFNGSK